jgi:glycosyltransferase involved in cell wall biosynthesis
VRHKIAVLMSVYKNDRVEYLKQSVESILHQTEKDFILFILCDGPITMEADQYLSSLPIDRVVLKRRNVNLGLAVSLNELIDTANDFGIFKYYARMDADDVSDLKRFELQSNFLDSHDNVDVVGSWYIEIDSHGIPNREIRLPTGHQELLRFMVKRSPFAHPTVMMRSDIFKQDMRYDKSWRFSEDYAFWVMLAGKGYRFANTPNSLLLYRRDISFFSRRKGLGRAVEDALLRYHHVKKHNLHSVKNYLLIFGIFCLRLSPVFIVKFAYRHLR